ncbi:MAG: hypothetical protein KJ622_06100 [Alphaproteobacteria bacterium]|nr:hypothetical protein [Alphaproteobacteria bacterium]
MDMRTMEDMPQSSSGAFNCLIYALVTIVFLVILTDTGSAQGHGYDCAHGPDTYRVRNVADWDKLNIRSGPSAGTRIAGQIDAYGSGVHCLGPCQATWCRVSWRGIVGWTNMQYLGE